jgi:hypothetical protein
MVKINDEIILEYFNNAIYFVNNVEAFLIISLISFLG